MRALLPAALLLALALAGCASNTAPQTGPPSQPLDGGNAPATRTSSAAAPTGGPQDHAVAITGGAFAPQSVAAKAGDSVTWSNQDTATHTVTADDGSFDSGNLAGKATFHHAFASAGSFSYHCKIHPSMVGTVTVQ
jgi:plastocyanin